MRSHPLRLFLLVPFLLAAAPARAADAPQIELPPEPAPRKPARWEPMFRAEIPVIATWEGKPIRRGRVSAESCADEPDFFLPRSLEYLTDYKGRVSVTMGSMLSSKTPRRMTVCATLRSEEGVPLATAKSDFDPSVKIEPLLLKVSGRLQGASASMIPLGKDVETLALKALHSGPPLERAIAASLALRDHPPLALLTPMAEALEREYDAGSPKDSTLARNTLVHALRRYVFYEPRRTHALERAAKDDPDPALRKTAAEAKALAKP
jgi:hypothetical protein